MRTAVSLEEGSALMVIGVSSVIPRQTYTNELLKLAEILVIFTFFVCSNRRHYV